MNIAILSIHTYVIFTILFFILKHYTYDQTSQISESSITWLSLFFVCSFIIIFIQNLYFSKMSDGETKCVVQPLNVFIYTLLPLLFVMLPIMFFLNSMNWHRIFSNTFGLMLVPKIELGDGSPSFFYNDPNILLQEIDPIVLNNITDLRGRLTILLGTPVNITDAEHTAILAQHKLKQNVGYFTWLVLTGIITALISSNSILLQDCIIE